MARASHMAGARAMLLNVNDTEGASMMPTFSHKLNFSSATHSTVLSTVSASQAKTFTLADVAEAS